MTAEGTIAITARLDIRPETLKTMVENMKQAAGRDEKGIYRIDTAEGVNRLVSRFLEEAGFDTWVRDPGRYADLFGPGR